MTSKKNGKNIIYFLIFGSLLIVGIIIFMLVKKNDNYDSGEHTIAADGCNNLKRDFSSKFSILDKCGDVNSKCVDPLSLKTLCDPTVSNIYLLHDSKDMDRSAGYIWAITNVLVISKNEWENFKDKYKSEGWVACGKNQGTIPGIQVAEPLDTNIETLTTSAFLCVQYKKVDVNSTTPILTSIKADHFTFGKSTCSGREVKTVGKISKNLIAGPDSVFKSTCYAMGGCTIYEPANKCTKYIQSIILNYAKSPELNRYVVERNIEPGNSYTGIMLTFPSSKMKAIEWKYRTANPNSPLLSFGDILALAGDFYGIPDMPITPLRAAPNLENEKQRFLNCFNTLKNNQGEELTKIMEIFKDNMQKINDYLIYGKLVSDFYHNLGIEDDIKYNKITGGGADAIPDDVFAIKLLSLAFQGRYIKLAQNNYDHFCEKNHAYRSYMAGHTVAMETAAFAKSSGDDSLLNMAYAYDAFACHFLSDHFSSGHIRVPREDLHEGRNCSPGNKEYDWFGAAGDYCSKLMHDEDNRLGLMVANNACYVENPDPSICKVWRAYGDGYMADPQNQENLKRQQEVLQISVDEVWNSYVNGSPIKSKVFLYIPCIDERAKIPKLDIEGRIVGYYPNVDIKNDTFGKTPVKIGERSSLNHTPMFLAPDPAIYGKEYNCLYKRVGDDKMTYVFSPLMAIADFVVPGSKFFPGVTHGE